jgi:NAD(P)-dependent dehydrogenase (short-subunit alcohol dehydrogenase family)
MLLQNKKAVIYGGGGAIGGAVARAFAREEAIPFLARRTLVKLDRVAKDISAAGGMVETAAVAALDEKAVDRHTDAVVAAGRHQHCVKRCRHHARYRVAIEAIALER